MISEELVVHSCNLGRLVHNIAYICKHIENSIKYIAAFKNYSHPEISTQTITFWEPTLTSAETNGSFALSLTEKGITFDILLYCYLFIYLSTYLSNHCSILIPFKS